MPKYDNAERQETVSHKDWCEALDETYEMGDQGFFDPFLIKGLKYPVRNKSH